MRLALFCYINVTIHSSTFMILVFKYVARGEEEGVSLVVGRLVAFHTTSFYILRIIRA